MTDEQERYMPPEWQGVAENAEDIFDTEIKINPSFYVHLALIKAQEALVKDDVRAGFAQYRSIVEHLEVIARAAKMIRTDYDEEINNFLTQDKNYLDTPDDYAKSMKLANKKLALITKAFFESRTSKVQLHDKPNLA